MEFQFTITAVFDGDSVEDIWDEWVMWLSHPRHIEDGTEVTPLDSKVWNRVVIEDE